MSTLSVDTIQGKTTAGTVAMPSGHVVQTVSNTSYSSATYSLSASTEQNTLSCSITPKFSNSHMFIQCFWYYAPIGSDDDFGLAMRREIGGSLTGYVNGSQNMDSARGKFTVGSFTREPFFWHDDAPNNANGSRIFYDYSVMPASAFLKDTYSGTDARTYQLTLGTAGSGKTVYWNKTTQNVVSGGGNTAIIIQEIKQ
jgi:hypothetical protein|tara:strand:- start:6 stop:599 length:594 start_codon:yes stop_codon:yes gene_type:complete